MIKVAEIKTKEECIELLMVLTTGKQEYDIESAYVCLGNGGMEAGCKCDNLVDGLYKRAFGDEYLNMQEEFEKKQHDLWSDYAQKLNDMLLRETEKIKGEKIEHEIITRDYKGEVIKTEKM